MNTEFYSELDNEVLSRCGKIIRDGGLVCFPTETVYGLGADAFITDAVNAVYEAKGRPHDNPLIVHISELSEAEKVTDMTEVERDRFGKMAEAFWPGPLTMIVTKKMQCPKKFPADLKLLVCACRLIKLQEIL